VTVDLATHHSSGAAGHDTVADINVLVVGSPFADKLYGGPRADLLYGNGGPDLIVGRMSNDELRGGGGLGYFNQRDDKSPDRLIGGKGNDHIADSGGGDSIDGGPGSDDMFGHEGARIRGGGGKDFVQYRLVSAGGRHLIDLGSGDDFLDLSVRLGRKVALTTDLKQGVLKVKRPSLRFGFRSVETIELTQPNGTWHVIGTGRAESFVTSFRVPITVRARGGDDRVEGSSQADFIDGGGGHDRADSGGGHDTCVSVEDQHLFNSKKCEVSS
jgi:Ca2+-binding RTX toxin-like protein